jgi:DMSO/TMAO reductase YedYZ heme-binding membrane subunit
MSDQIFWFLSRSSGLMSWLAAAGAMLVGTMIPSRLLGRKPTIPWLTDLHRMLAAMASIFLLIHMGTLWFDHFVAFRFDDLLIPFVATVPGLSRLSLALGVIAFWLVAAVQLTSLFRHRFYESTWRTIHLSSYASLVLGSVHAVLAGSDIGNPIIAALGTSVLTAVALATVVRVRRMRQQRRAAPVQEPQAERPPAPRPDWPGPSVSATSARTMPPADRPDPGPWGRG